MEELKLLFLCAFHSLAAQDHYNPGQKLWELAMGCSVKRKPNIINLSACFSPQTQPFHEEQITGLHFLEAVL